MSSPARRLVAVLSTLLLGSAVLAAPAAADEPGKYYDGAIGYSQVVNCPSIIWGSPYTEPGIGAYTGYYADPDSGVPAVGQPVYLHVVVSGLGFPCSGGTRLWPSIDLPAGVAPYPSAPIQCYYDGAPMTGNDCPSWGNFGGAGPNGSTRYVKNPGNATDTWGVAQGHTLEFLFPVVGSQVLTGAQARVFLETADGNENPTLRLTAPMYVFGSGAGAVPSVMYDKPSTYTSALLPGTGQPSRFGIVSEFMAVAHGQAGTAFLEIGRRSGAYPERVSLAIPAGYQSFRMWGDWDEPTVTTLVPGRRYFWRGGWDPGGPGGGDVVRGAEQSFVAPAGRTCLGRPVTVNVSLGELPTAGPDVILGTSGADEVSGLGGEDVVCGLGGADRIDGGDGDDLVDAGAGADLVASVAGSDASRGGPGVDTVSYAAATAGVALDLGVTTEQDTGGAGRDIVTGFESAVGGSAADVLRGTGGANTLTGARGGDTLAGRAGGDSLAGGKGRDSCGGGPGRDAASGCERTTSVP